MSEIPPNLGRHAAIASLAVKVAAPGQLLLGAGKLGWGQRLGAGIKSLGRGIGHAFVGTPSKVLSEGMNTFRPGGTLATHNVWWPSTEGLTGRQKIMPWLHRLQTVALPYQTYQRVKHDTENDTVTTKALAGAGSLIGGAYGHTGFGMLGGAIGSGVIGRAGRGVGRILSGTPQAQPPPWHYAHDRQYLPDDAAAYAHSWAPAVNPAAKLGALLRAPATPTNTNPMFSGQAAAGAPPLSTATAPKAPAPPLAAGAAKAHVLG